ncbi:putative carboxylesterase [Eremomyces bilateralis CBS 781.70]|uniref:Carboxylic ester hydrolase n=1 Tax=Eremomyces bilateralis CBS 781.70 TaxID=1392243 RepID=A0A6G1G305_9PEZI|nr:putative carboxylesterase [Eremomyces bilateralis CBS 781.70]KAF1812311.1 putative carboxylesterase [Eremomyces bilateralis CBS 781.70]
MAYLPTPHLLHLQSHGFIRGHLLTSPTTHRPLCTYYGGVPYALPPTGEFRWQVPRALPPCYAYGTRNAPGEFTEGCGVCPQVGGEGEQEQEEDCLGCNVWVPVGEAPVGGWPVLFYIHGGFLQFGDPNSGDVVPLISETEVKCIIVKPGYRLNVFGFLSLEHARPEGSNSIASNFGLWDQRMALMWTYKNISYFGGDPANITLAGYSAGAYSAFHQLAYDLWQPQQLIRRCIMWSNGPGIQPRPPSEGHTQFNELLTALQIPTTLDIETQIQKLRAASPSALLTATRAIQRHQFRPVTDGRFVRRELFADIDRGEFAARMQRRNIALMIGECEHERHVYGTYIPPANSYIGLRDRLEVDFPGVADRLMGYYFPAKRLPAQWGDWREAFGAVYADVQVYCLQRGLVARIARTAPGLVWRYRVEWRAGCVELPVEWGATHTTDLAIWFWGEGRLTGREKRVVEEGFVRGLAAFVTGKEGGWGTRTEREVRRLRADGRVEIWLDEEWDRGVELWELLRSGDVGTTARANL